MVIANQVLVYNSFLSWVFKRLDDSLEMYRSGLEAKSPQVRFHFILTYLIGKYKRILFMDKNMNASKGFIPK
jgi:hypothetical protein